jgi:hypothetical protein
MAKSTIGNIHPEQTCYKCTHLPTCRMFKMVHDSNEYKITAWSWYFFASAADIGSLCIQYLLKEGGH